MFQLILLYIAIIVWEALTAAMCFAGAYFLLKKAPSALKIATLALTMRFLLFMVGFVIIAGEWFYLLGSAAAPMRMKALLFSLLMGGATCFVMLAPDRLT
ncbi:MAG: DUF2165 family protein [Chlamydiales bacterium]|nr:DUF2165 family protein [Chlamydiales bacterium]